MKFIKYLLFFIIALILLFLLIGLVKPTVSYGHEITVDKSVEESWAVVLDESKYPLWLEGYKSIELIEGEEGAIGSKYKVIVNPGEGQPDFEMIETVVDYKENQFVNLHFDSEMMDFDQITTVAVKNGKTTIKTDSKVAGKGIMMRSMFALMEMTTGSFTAQETKNIEALKVVINENKKNYFQETMSDTLRLIQ